MTRHPVQSSAVRSVGHDPVTNTLEVEMASGKVYRYTDVPVQQFQALLRAPSIGQHLNTQVKEKYAYDVVGPEPSPEDPEAKS